MSHADGFVNRGIARSAIDRLAKVIAPIGIVIGLIAGCMSTTTASPLVTATPTVIVTPMVTTTSPVLSPSRAPLSTRLLTGTFAVPSGFLVASINPLVPADAAPFGEVDASVTSPGGVAYGVLFSPTVVPCDYAACTSRTTTLAVRDATPHAVHANTLRLCQAASMALTLVACALYAVSAVLGMLGVIFTARDVPIKEDTDGTPYDNFPQRKGSLFDGFVAQRGPTLVGLGVIVGAAGGIVSLNWSA